MDSLHQLLNSLHFWHWFAAAIVLFVIELLVGGGFLFWIGCAAALTGVLVWLVPTIYWPYQLIFFAILSVVVAVVWWRYLKRNPLKTDRPSLNRRNEQYIGRVFTLEQAIVNNRGSVRVDDSTWRIQCEENLPMGSKVIIIGVDGVVLIAKAHKTP